MMTEKMDDDFKASSYIFKVLSGSLNGIEFSLSAHDYFMCVGDAAEEQGNVAKNLEFADRTLYLPAVASSHNFTVHLGQKVTEQAFETTVSYLTHQDTLSLVFNTICQIGGVHFALKRAGEVWSEEVLKGVLPSTPTFVAETKTKVAPTSSTRSRVLAWSYKGLIAVGMLVLGFGSAMAWLNYHSEKDTSPVVLEELIGKQVGYSVQLGRDNIYYIFAQNNQQADWARQAVARSTSGESWKVVTPQEEEARLARVLEHHQIGFFTIRFSDPRAPTLVMNSQNNSTDTKSLESINKMLLDALPYARTVHIDLQNDQDVIRSAQEGLLALGFDYQMIQSDKGVTLTSHMTAGDSRLAEFSRFVEQFYRTWGRRYVHFSAELRDDWLKEKSFKYGQDGYVNMSKSHWLFNSTQN